MNSMSGVRRDLFAREWGATVVEYTLLIGIIATVGISAIRTVGNSLAGTADPCNPGTLVRVAQILGGQDARNLECKEPKVP